MMAKANGYVGIVLGCHVKISDVLEAIRSKTRNEISQGETDQPCHQPEISTTPACRSRSVDFAMAGQELSPSPLAIKDVFCS